MRARRTSICAEPVIAALWRFGWRVQDRLPRAAKPARSEILQRPAARRRPGIQQPPALRPGAGSQVDHPIGAADQIGVVLHDDDGRPRPHQAVQHAQQTRQILRVQPVEGSSSTSSWLASDLPAQVARQLDALRLAARKGRRRLSQRQVAQADILQAPAGCAAPVCRLAAGRLLSAAKNVSACETVRSKKSAMDKAAARANGTRTASTSSVKRSPSQSAHGTQVGGR